jgi:hypothetical protein
MHLYVTICMKLDPSMHIGMHLVSYRKSGVTEGRAGGGSGAQIGEEGVRGRSAGVDAYSFGKRHF